MTLALQLGASLYVPATRSDLIPIGNGEKYPDLRSVIFCTEDSLHPRQMVLALQNLAATLPHLEEETPSQLLRFIRVRNPGVLRSLLQMDGLERITGFVLPKVTRQNLGEYFDLLLPEMPFRVMLTLETAEAFDPVEMNLLRNLIAQERYRQRVLALRIGGNDLLNLLGLRRPRSRTLYDTPLGTTMGQLVATFRPHGFHLTAPVYEYLDRDDVLTREVRRDLLHGLIGKSAIHPLQVPLIEACYRVHPADLQAAEHILAQSAPPVFRLCDAMCEPATHHAWAAITLQRAEIYGLTARPRRTWTRGS